MWWFWGGAGSHFSLELQGHFIHLFRNVSKLEDVTVAGQQTSSQSSLIGSCHLWVLK